MEVLWRTVIHDWLTQLPLLHVGHINDISFYLPYLNTGLKASIRAALLQMCLQTLWVVATKGHGYPVMGVTMLLDACRQYDLHGDEV